MFGHSVGLSRSTAIVGAPADGKAGKEAGAAYFFDADSGGSWTQIARVAASDAAAGDFFGHAVALSGDLAIVGAPLKNGESGAAYLFQNDGTGCWKETAKLTAADATTNQSFGWSVALRGRIAIVGAYGDKARGPRTGAAYVFQCEPFGNWKQMAKLTATDASACSSFGWSVALCGDVAVVGAHEERSTHFFAGAAYVFQRKDEASWLQVAKLTASDATKGDHFGWSVATNERTIVIGAPLSANCSGAAYRFDVDPSGNWYQTAKYVPNDSQPDDWFGVSVAISDAAIFVGAPLNNSVASNAGAAYVFDSNSSR
jgi:hypothetical protein